MSSAGFLHKAVILLLSHHTTASLVIGGGGALQRETISLEYAIHDDRCIPRHGNLFGLSFPSFSKSAFGRGVEHPHIPLRNLSYTEL